MNDITLAQNRSIRYHESGHTLALFLISQSKERVFRAAFSHQILLSEREGGVKINNQVRLTEARWIILFLAWCLAQNMTDENVEEFFLKRTWEKYKNSDTQKIIEILIHESHIHPLLIRATLSELYNTCQEYLSSKFLLGHYVQKIAHAHHKKQSLEADDIIGILGKDIPKLYFTTTIQDLEERVETILERYRRRSKDISPPR